MIKMAMERHLNRARANRRQRSAVVEIP